MEPRHTVRRRRAARVDRERSLIGAERVLARTVLLEKLGLEHEERCVACVSCNGFPDRLPRCREHVSLSDTEPPSKATGNPPDPKRAPVRSSPPLQERARGPERRLRACSRPPPSGCRLRHARVFRRSSPRLAAPSLTFPGRGSLVFPEARASPQPQPPQAGPRRHIRDVFALAPPRASSFWSSWVFWPCLYRPGRPAPFSTTTTRFVAPPGKRSRLPSGHITSMRSIVTPPGRPKWARGSLLER